MILYVVAKSNSIGERLLEAFETDDKEFIAQKLGFTSKQAVYKVLSGERELDFEKLQRFRNYTKCSIDWLLTGEGSKLANPVKEFDLQYSVDKHDNWRDVMQDWFEWEGKEMPETMGASFMGGWNGLTKKERMDAVRDFKMLLDKVADGDDDD